MQQESISREDQLTIAFNKTVESTLTTIKAEYTPESGSILQDCFGDIVKDHGINIDDAIDDLCISLKEKLNNHFTTQIQLSHVKEGLSALDAASINDPLFSTLFEAKQAQRDSYNLSNARLEENIHELNELKQQKVNGMQEQLTKLRSAERNISKSSDLAAKSISEK